MTNWEAPATTSPRRSSRGTARTIRTTNSLTCRDSCCALTIHLLMVALPSTSSVRASASISTSSFERTSARRADSGGEKAKATDCVPPIRSSNDFRSSALVGGRGGLGFASPAEVGLEAGDCACDLRRFGGRESLVHLGSAITPAADAVVEGVRPNRRVLRRGRRFGRRLRWRLGVGTLV